MSFRILIIDNYGSSNASILPALADSGYDCRVITGRDEVAFALKEHAPHAILVNCGGISAFGPYLIGLLKSQDNIPIVVMGDYGACEESEKKLLEDRIDYAIWPSPPRQICRILQRAIERMELKLLNAGSQKALEEQSRKIVVLEESLLQTERMAALGSLTAGVAHDINTPLGSIIGNNDVLAVAVEKILALSKQPEQLNALGMSEEISNLSCAIEDTLKTNRRACDYIARIVSDLRKFAHGGLGERRRADVHESIEFALAIVAHELKHQIVVKKEFGNIPHIECYPNQLDQVFVNMLLNAAQAISGPGEIRIRTWAEADMVRIAISDTGCGIAPEFHGRIFEAGFTTKTSGTGLGLSTSRKIIANHGGWIELKSQIENGSTFTIMLPVGYAEEKSSDG
jgi:signal transduction histidine kinase